MKIDLFELQSAIVKASHAYTEHYAITRSHDWTALKFAEEAGECIQAYLKLSGQSRHKLEPSQAQEQLASEIADVIGMALIMAKEHQLDLRPAFERKWHIDLSKISEELA
jgi:NTP pyrophosphatase (non-canonical NTP hydrolase)